MTLKDIALIHLRRRRGRAALVLAGLAVGVAAMVAAVSLTNALQHEITHKLEKYGANILVTPRSERLDLSYEGLSLGGFSFESGSIAQEDLARIRHIKNAANLAAVGPVLLGVAPVAGRRAVISGVDFGEARILRPWWKWQGAEPGPGALLLGSEAARLLAVQPGSQLQVAGRGLKVAAVLEPTGSQDDGLIFTDLATAQGLLGKPGQVSMVEVAALCKDCPIDDMVAQIGKVLPRAQVRAIQSVVKGRMETLRQLGNFSLGISALVGLVGALVVLVTMTASVRERTVEIGVFRAVGFRRGQVMRVILLEAALISLAAGLVGWLAGLGAGEAALPWLSQGHGVHVNLDPILGGAAILAALLLGTLASLYPALSAARLDPQEALRAL